VKNMRDRRPRGLWALGLLAPVVLLCCVASGCREQPKQAQPAPQKTAERPAADAEVLAALEKGEQVSLAQFKHVLASASPQDRSEVLSRLALVEDPSGAVALAIEVLEHDPDFSVQASAVMPLTIALRQGLKPDPTAALLRAAKEKAGPVRVAAVQALAWAKGPEVEAVLERARASENPTELRTQALKSLMAIYARQGLTGWRKLTGFLGKTKDDQSALAAIEFTVTGRPTVPVLIETLATGQDAHQREAAATVLATICAGRTKTSLAFGKRAKYLAGMSEREEPPDLRAVEPLLRALNDPYYPVREAAALGLGFLGDARAVEPLGKALEDPAMPVRRRAASALILLPAKPVIPALARRVRTDESAAVREFAVEALGWTKDLAAVQPLIDALRDSDADVRAVAADFLGDLGDKRAAEPLTRLFNDPEVDVRWAAVRSAGKLGGEQVCLALLNVYNDSEQPSQVVQAADDALRRMGHLVTYSASDKEVLRK